MKIRNSSRITAIVLALVMLLPLISIPTFAEPEDNILFYEDFSSYAGLEGAELLQQMKQKWRRYPTNGQAVTEGDNTYLKFPMQALIAEGGEYDTEYYLYANYTKWDKAINGEIASYDPATATITFAPTDTYPEGHSVTVDTSKGNADGKYGNVSFGGSTWEFTTGEYAACMKFGDGACIDQPGHIMFGDNEMYTATDADVLAGLKNAGDVKNYFGGFSHEDVTKVHFSYKIFIEEGSKGKLNLQLNYIDCASGNDKMYVELTNLDLGAGTFDNALSGVVIPQGEWVTISFIVNLETGAVQGLYDGKLYGTINISNKGFAAPITGLKGWTVTKVLKQVPTALAGAFYIDDVTVDTNADLGSLITYEAWTEDFEEYPANKTLQEVGSAKWNRAPAYPIVEVDGSMVMQLLSTDRNNNNFKPKFDAITAEMGDVWTYSVDYKIPSGTQDMWQTQGHNAFYGKKADGSSGSVGWADLFVVDAQNGSASLKREGGNRGGYPLPFDQWFNITMEITLSNASYDVYVNGVPALVGQTVPGGLVSIDGINAASFCTVKQINAAGGYASGGLYVDNFSLQKGACGIDPVTSFNLIDEWNAEGGKFTYYPSSIEDMPDAFSVMGGYSGIAGAEITLDEDEYVDSLILNLESVLGEDGSELNIDKMLRPRTPGFDFDVFDTVILNATYNVSEDAQGKFESQLFDASISSWQDLYVIDADNATVEGAAFTKGEDFTVTTVVHSNGYVQIYLNNVLVKNANVVKTNGLNGGEWSLAKVQKYCEAYAGTVTMTNITIDTEYAEELAINDFYLYEQADMLSLSAGSLKTVDAASIRLFAPTGLRFATQLGDEVLALASNNIKIGTLIAPAEYVEAAGAFTKEALAELNYVTSYIDVVAELNNLYNGNGTSAALPEGNYFTASIVNIREGNIDCDFAAIGYIQYTIGEETVTIYSENYAVANVQEIAAAAQEDFADTEYAGIINAYAAGLQPKY